MNIGISESGGFGIGLSDAHMPFWFKFFIFCIKYIMVSSQLSVQLVS